MFERIEIADSIYEGVVTPSYNKKLLGHKPTILYSVGIRRQKPPLSNTHPMKNGNAVKGRK